MSWEIALLVYGLVMAGCLLGGVLIGTVIGIVGILGITMVSGTRLWISLGDIVWNTSTSFTLVSIPLFVLMGEIILRSGVSGRFYAGVSRIFGRIPGGLAHTNILGCAVFSALSGSTVATTMTMGTVALPEMRSRGYSDGLTLGTLTGGGCLGILIPPSIPMIVYASVTQESVLAMFAAGILPGIVLTVAFACYVSFRVFFNRSLAPSGSAAVGDASLLGSLADTLPVVLLIAAVLGGMYWGLVTPTEAAGFGCAVAILIALVYRDFSLDALGQSLKNAVITSCVVLFITINAQFLSFAVVQAGIGRGISNYLTDLNLAPFVMFLAIVCLYIVLGMFIDGLSIMLLTVPVLYPALSGLGFPGVWLGVVIIVLIELGALTPPMGLNLFAVQSISPKTPMSVIGRSSLPYAAIILGLCFLLYAWPDLALYLPELMHN
ncbi:TRAP transporter large permease [Microbaculum marinum]|uniref:TRAP transporter large permease protein n=1 Tax=Microbaculum marinum TaxID=1764581 RepID=A0AAW9RP08_9HYPH